MDTIQHCAPRYDAVVVGARCAGAATAMLLARAGVRVLLVDRQAYGTDTMSTHALMRAGVLLLGRWGILPEVMAAGTPPIRRTTFHYGGESVSIDIRPEHGVPHLCAPRRNILDRILVDAAARAGADIRHGVALTDLLRGRDNRVTGVCLTRADGVGMRVEAPLVIGADGRRSTLARLVGAETLMESEHASGCAYGYFEGLDNDGTQWHFVEHAAAGVIPTNDGHCIFASMSKSKFRETFRGDVDAAFLEVLGRNSSELRDTVLGTRMTGRLRGFAGAPGHLRQSHGPGWALVGDAGYFKDPITAHGITDAFRDADILARAVLAGNEAAIAAYQEERDALARPFLGITDAVASFEWTVDEVKSLHAQLSATMRAETDHITKSTLPANLAA